MWRESCGSPCDPCATYDVCWHVACCSVLVTSPIASALHLSQKLCKQVSYPLVFLSLIVNDKLAEPHPVLLGCLSLSDCAALHVSSRAAGPPTSYMPDHARDMILSGKHTATIAPVAICSSANCAHFYCPRSGSVGICCGWQESRSSSL